MKCPTCTDVTLVIADRSGIEIDYCPQCRGVWLDRGELDRLVERAAADMAPAWRGPDRHDRDRQDRDADRRYGRDDDRRSGDDREHSYKRRKKSFLDELFDF